MATLDTGRLERVLIFNGNQKLIAIARSASAVHKIAGCSVSAVNKACSGSIISSRGFYLRHIPNDVVITLDDLDNLDLKEYDDLCEESREYHSQKKMSRKLKASKGEELAPIKKKRKQRKQKGTL